MMTRSPTTGPSEAKDQMMAKIKATTKAMSENFPVIIVLFGLAFSS